jgi:hypothetical protein
MTFKTNHYIVKRFTAHYIPCIVLIIYLELALLVKNSYMKERTMSYNEAANAEQE